MKKCTKCKLEKPLTSFYKASHLVSGKRPECADCHKAQQKVRKNTVEGKIYQMADSILKRVSGLGKRNEGYVRKGIKCKIGDSKEEVILFITTNFYGDIKKMLDEGKIPSIDRIDEEKNYENGNLRIIEWYENTLRGVENSKKVCSKPIEITLVTGETLIFSSISEASRELSCKRDTILAAIYQRTKSKRFKDAKYLTK